MCYPHRINICYFSYFLYFTFNIFSLTQCASNSARNFCARCKIAEFSCDFALEYFHARIWGNKLARNRAWRSVSMPLAINSRKRSTRAAERPRRAFPGRVPPAFVHLESRVHAITGERCPTSGTRVLLNERRRRSRCSSCRVCTAARGNAHRVACGIRRDKRRVAKREKGKDSDGKVVRFTRRAVFPERPVVTAAAAAVNACNLHRRRCN